MALMSSYGLFPNPNGPKDKASITFKTHEQAVAPRYFGCISIQVRLGRKQGNNFLVIYAFNLPIIAHVKRIHKGNVICMILEAFLVGNIFALYKTKVNNL